MPADRAAKFMRSHRKDFQRARGLAEWCGAAAPSPAENT